MGWAAWRASSVVDEDVKRPLFCGLHSRVAHGIGLGKVGHGNAVACAGEPLDGLLQTLRIPCHQGALGPQFCQLIGCCPADSL